MAEGPRTPETQKALYQTLQRVVTAVKKGEQVITSLEVSQSLVDVTPEGAASASFATTGEVTYKFVIEPAGGQTRFTQQ
jgi:hypothetical protein